MGVVRLNLGHDHLEDLFESLAELNHDLRFRLGTNSCHALDNEIKKTLYEIRLMSKKLKGQKQDECTDYEFHWRILQNQNTTVARLEDTIHNGSSKSRIPNKSITEQAEDADRTSRLILHSIYPGRNGRLKRYVTIASDLFPEQVEIYQELTKKIQQLMSIERGYHENHPDAQRPKKATGAPIPHPTLLRPVLGFKNLPECIEPTNVLGAVLDS